ncbi:MAG: FAD binding domain-containing protein [Janthinobacterium lividum]
MRPFILERAADVPEALRLTAAHVDSHYLAGGTTLLDLMKLDVMHPGAMIDVNALRSDYGGIMVDGNGLYLGALVRMAAAAEHSALKRDYPILSDALRQAASPQLRNMASLGGNVLQRTRCPYFRDPTWAACNKRTPGSGCAAMGGVNRLLAILGTSADCIAHYPGDFAVALAALDARVDVLGPDGARSMAFTDLHRSPGDTPHVETTLRPAELIAGFHVPAGPWTRRSLYLKVRDRASYAFAIASAAVALELDVDGTVKVARIGLGGLATRPWRSHEAEAVLVGRIPDQAAAQEAAETAFAAAVTHGDNDFKPELGRRTLVRALLAAAHMEA